MDENTFYNIAGAITIFFVPVAVVAIFQLFKIVRELNKKTQKQSESIALLEAKLKVKGKDK